MIRLFKRWLKARLCEPCGIFCGNDLCRKIGCLNADKQTNARLKLLVKRLENTGYEFVTEEKETQEQIDNVYNIEDFRKND